MNKSLGKKKQSPILSSPPTIAREGDNISQIYRNLLFVDEKAANEAVQQHAVNESDRQFSAKITELEFEKEQIDVRFGISEDTLSELELQHKTTPRFVVCNTDDTGKSPPQSSFLSWSFMDQVGFILTLSGMLVALFVGTANVFSNLQASSLPIFIDTPILAWLISMLMPLGSLSIKYISHIFVTYRNKKRFACAIYGLSAITLLMWTVAFSLNFSGVSSGIDWDSIGNSSNKGSFLVWLQLTAEILVAASLALAADQIFQKNNPDTLVDNKAFQRISILLTEHKAAHDKLSSERSRIYGQLAELNADRALLIEQRLAAYQALRARFNHITNF